MSYSISPTLGQSEIESVVVTDSSLLHLKLPTASMEFVATVTWSGTVSCVVVK